MNERVRRGVMGEMRAVPEFAAFLATTPVLRLAPRGDGHAVLVLPGWGGDDRSTQPLRWFLREQGYWVHGWRLGTNEGITDRVSSGLARRLEQVAERHGGRVSLVGWSLGGVYARALARYTPQSVRTVITMGSPINVTGARGALPVPSTSIYSRSDAVVPYRESLVPPGSNSENVEVRGSHLGLGHNPAVLYVVADRLARKPGHWKPFRPPAALRSFYPTHDGETTSV